MKNFPIFKNVLCVFAFLFSIQTPIFAQFTDFQIIGPYDNHLGSYHIRTYINFVVNPSSPWLDTLEAESYTDGMMYNLNNAFNKHNIYFVSASNGCSENEPNIISTTYSNVLDIRSFVAGGKHNDGYDIYVFSVSGTYVENNTSAFHIPNRFCALTGETEENVPSILSPILIHIVGHTFGLFHNFEDLYGMQGEDSCPDEVTCPTLTPTCNCCYDFVCDTPDDSGYECGTDSFASNYMTSSDSWSCRNFFTPKQADRMREHLRDSDTLQAMRFNTSIPGGSISNPSGDIIIESGTYTVNSLIEMLPNARIYVRAGAHLKVNATITGACGSMWGGIVLEGSGLNAAQDTNAQGRVTLSNTGKIEHARVAIEVMNVNDDSGQLVKGSGGIVSISGGIFINNSVGIRFGEFSSSNSNKSYLAGARFAITDDYRGDSLTMPVFVDMLGIKGLNMANCYFQDNRTGCSHASIRAIGVSSFNSGFRITSSQFNNLSIGVDAKELTKDSGSFRVTNSNFYKCYLNISSLDNSAFAISGNDFYMNKVSACPSTTGGEIVGVEIKGNTNGFAFNDNLFSLFDGNPPVDTLIGTKCIDLGEGMGNIIWKNEYISLNYGNVASGMNGGTDDGLLYLCNYHTGTYNADYQVLGSIKYYQEDISDFDLLPTGVKFSDDNQSKTINNIGTNIDYRFFSSISLAPFENPWVASGPIGIDTIPSNIPNQNCNEIEPCIVCTESEKEILKTRFAENKELWLTKLDNVPNIYNETQLQLELDTIRMLRILMNKDAGKLMRQYALDTNTIKTDSIVLWLKLAQTFGAELEIAKHLFFSQNFNAFDSQ